MSELIGVRSPKLYQSSNSLGLELGSTFVRALTSQQSGLRSDSLSSVPAVALGEGGQPSLGGMPRLFFRQLIAMSPAPSKCIRPAGRPRADLSECAGQYQRQDRVGFYLGGGTEVAIDQHWSAKLESLVVNSGTSTHFVFTDGNAMAEFKERFVIVRFGLNYAFN